MRREKRSLPSQRIHRIKISEAVLSFLIGDEIHREIEISLRSFNRLNLFLRGEPSASINIEILVEDVHASSPEVSFSADPTSIMLGDRSLLVWETRFAETVSIDPDIGDVELNGSVNAYPQETATYTITATGTGGITTQDVTVEVAYLTPEVYLTADPKTIVSGEATTLSWTSDYAESCVIEPDVGVVGLDWYMVISPVDTTPYTIVATGPGGTATAEFSVIVTDPAPIVSISADPNTIQILDL